MTRRPDELTAAFINSASVSLYATIARLNTGDYPESEYATAMAEYQNVLTKIMETDD